VRWVLLWICCSLVACNGDDNGTEDPCGPETGTVVNIVDGDTVDLESGVRIRYMLTDTPERSKNECFADEAALYNGQLVLNQEVEIEYDEECEDRYDRTLAYVSIGDTLVNRVLVERGYACVLHIPPNGVDRVDGFLADQQAAEDAARGLWGACDSAAADFPTACE
jgi:micrococcal nuclease